MYTGTLASAALLALSSFAVAAPTASGTTSAAVCTKSPYSQYLPLSDYYLATQYCTSMYPLPCSGSASPLTKTLTKTTSKTSTITVEANPIHTTVTTGDPATTTVRTTVTPAPVTRTATVTHLITIGVNSLLGINVKRSPATTSGVTSLNSASMSSLMSGVSWFAGRDSSFYKTLCSCIETTPACARKTSTSTVTTAVTATVTQAHTGTRTDGVANSARVTKVSTVTAVAATTTTTVTKDLILSAGVTLGLHL